MANYQLEQTGAEVQALLNAVESPDTTPAAGSSNLITSGAVQAAVAGVSAEVTALGHKVDDLDAVVNGEPNPTPISVLVNELHYDATNVMGYLYNSHNTTKIEIYDVTDLQGRSVTFKSWRYNNNYMNYALVTDPTQIPVPSSIADLTTNMETYKAMWDSVVVDYQRSGANVELLPIPTGHASLFLLVQYNTSTMPLGTEFNLLNRTPSLDSRIDAIEGLPPASKQSAANAFLFPESDGTSESEEIQLPATGSLRFSFIPIEAAPKKRAIFSNSNGSFFFSVETNGTAYIKFNGSYLRPGIELVQGQPYTFEISWNGSNLTLTSGNYSGSIAYSTPMSETIKMYTRDAEYPLLSAQWLEASLNGNSFFFSKNFKFHKSRELDGASDKAVSLAVAAQSLYKPMRGVLFHHLNVEAAAADTIIPSQSLLDVRYAKALGFDFIEANIQKCSDDVLVVKHGASGLLGAGVKLIGGGDCSTTAFSSVTSTWLRENVVYDSVVTKNCISIPTFDEFCKACREESIGIMIAGYNLAADALAVARKYLPDNMLMVSGLSVRGDFKGAINGWWSITSVDDAVAKLEQYGLPFVLGWSDYGSASSALKEAVVLEMHKRGALVGSAYLKPAEVEEAKGFGLDMIASTKNEINPFNLGGLHNIHKLNDPALTFSSGAVYDSATDTIQMAAGSFLYLPNTDHSGGIVKMSVSIRYSGTLTIQPGTSSEPTEIKQYASDGNGFVSAGFTVERRANILRLAADTAVTIYDWSICASVVF